MEALTDDILAEIFLRGGAGNNAALVCRKWYEVDRISRRDVVMGETGCGLNTPESALTALCARFSNLTTVSIAYGGWTSPRHKQVDDACLKTLSICCTHLSDLKLSFCSCISDVGMVNLTGCQQLKAVRLEFTPRVTGRGLFSLVTGCCSLKLLHINGLMNVRVVEWLQFIGNNLSIESLGIRNCKGISEADLGLLGIRGWQNLREFAYEADFFQRHIADSVRQNGRSASLLEAWKFIDAQPDCCPNLQVLSLTNSLSRSGTGVTSLLFHCRSLDKLHLDSCVGIEDEDLILFVRHCSLVRSIYLHLPTSLLAATGIVPHKVTDATLLGVAQYCHSLENLTLSFDDNNLVPPFTEAGLEAIVENCSRLRHLSLNLASFFEDSTMMIVSQSESLQVLELSQCNELTDAGMMTVGQSNLKTLKICRCLRLTDAFLIPLKARKTLHFLSVEDCPQISQEDVADAAEVVVFQGTYSRSAQTASFILGI